MYERSLTERKTVQELTENTYMDDSKLLVKSIVDQSEDGMRFLRLLNEF